MYVYVCMYVHVTTKVGDLGINMHIYEIYIMFVSVQMCINTMYVFMYVCIRAYGCMYMLQQRCVPWVYRL